MHPGASESVSSSRTSREIRIAVRESPRHMGVAADDHRRVARQRRADQRVRTRVAPVVGCAIPRVRDANGQMHVVGDQCVAALGQAAGDCEAVAANGGITINAQFPTTFARPTPNNGSEQRWELGVESWEFGRLRPWRRKLDGRLAISTRTQVVDLRPGNRRNLQRIALDGAVPLAASRQQELGHGSRQQLVHRCRGRVVPAFAVLQRQEHGEHDEERIFLGPVRRPLAQEQILEWGRGELGEPGIAFLRRRPAGCRGSADGVVRPPVAPRRETGAVSLAGLPAKHARRPVRQAHPRRGAGPGPFERIDPARAGSPWLAPRLRARCRGWSGCQAHLV